MMLWPQYEAGGDLARLEALARSRTEPASRVERARILLAYRAEPSSTAVGERIGVTHQTVQRCVRRAARLGVIAALDDSPRPGKAPNITPDRGSRHWDADGVPHRLDRG